jgi:hypothetical protein
VLSFENSRTGNYAAYASRTPTVREGSSSAFFPNLVLACSTTITDQRNFTPPPIGCMNQDDRPIAEVLAGQKAYSTLTADRQSAGVT